MALILACILVLNLLCLPTLKADLPKVSLKSLLAEMVDRDRLARLPTPAYRSAQFTSYDRRSISPDKPGWFANEDQGNFLRTETNQGRREYVMMDADGPGAIVCFFKATTDPNAIVRIYLDGSPKPEIEENLRYFLGGGVETDQEAHYAEKRVPPQPPDQAHFLGGFGTLKFPFAGVQSLGCNLYLPIPYANHCKVTYDKPGRCYYRINYRTYPPSTPVETFTLPKLQESAGEIDRIGKLLLRDEPNTVAVNHLAAQTKSLLSSDSLTARLTGPAAVNQLQVKLNAADLPQALRSTVLSINCDGVQTVWCPVGDFFSSGVGLHPHHDWNNSVAADRTMRCFWVMPFKSSCTISLTNLGHQPVEATLGPICHAPWSWDDRSMHFHANWRQQYPIKTKAGDGTMDWNYLDAVGRGVYVGDTLVVHNQSTAWWGEGDEKIYVDSEPFPSHFGTGTEDYYGYSRGGSASIPFDAPFIAHPQVEGDSHTGYSAITRLRALDAIPFNNQLRFDMEVWHWAETSMAYAATTYWYATPGATCNRDPEKAEAQRPLLEDFQIAPARRN